MSWGGEQAPSTLEASVIPDDYVDPPFEFDAPRWDPLADGNRCKRKRE